MEIINIDTEEQFQGVLQNNTKVLVDFWAEWCGPCKAMNPVIKEFAESQDVIQVVKVNCDDFPELASKYDIRSIPCFVLLVHGQEITRFTGVVPLSKLDTLLADSYGL